MSAALNHKIFFDHVRQSVFRGRLSAKQVAGCEALLNTWARDYSDKPTSWLAYCLATAYHETAHTMQPIREYGRGKGRKYGRRSPVTGHAYYGRGYVQLTWDYNYRKAGKNLGQGDAFYRKPDLVLDPQIAAQILFRGSIEGWFTKRKLSDFIRSARTDYRGARRIINGMDRAGLIAGYAEAFDEALDAAIIKLSPIPAPSTINPDPAPPEEPKPVPPGTSGKKMPHSTTLWSAIGGALLNGFTAVVSLGEQQPVLAGLIILGGALAAGWIIRERWLKSRRDGV